MRLYFVKSQKVTRALHLGLVASAILYIVALTVPGIFLHRVSSAYAFVVGQDYHYSVALGASLRLQLDPAATLGDLRTNFGLLFSLLTASAADMFHVKTFGGWVRMIQLFQLLVLTAAIFSAWKLERNRLLVLAVALTGAAWISTMNQGVVAPTSSGLRFLNFALLPLALASLKTLRGPTSAVLAGFFASALILWNTETGIACTVALVFFVFVTEFARKHSLINSLSLAILTCVATAAIVGIGILILLGGSGAHWLFLEHLIEHVQGYNAHFLPFEPLAIVCALYASSVVIYCCFAVRAGLADSHLIARAAIAVAAIIWFAYYAHNAAFSALYSVIFLLSFTLAPLISMQRSHVPKIVWLLIVIANVQELVTVPARFGPGQPTFDGIILPTETAAFLNDHAERLKAAPPNTIYFSSTPFAMALASGRTNKLPIFDNFGETWTKTAFQRLMQNVETQQPACIFIEAENYPLLAVSPPRVLYMRRVQQSVSAKYQLRGTESGWDIWCRPTS